MDFVVTHKGVTRRDFLKTGGAMVVSFALPGCALAPAASQAPLPAAGSLWPAKVDPASLDSWLAIAADGSVTASVGKIEAGMGVGTAFAQIVAEELDVPIERVTIVMGDTASTVDQRGTGSSNGIMQGGAALRKAGAEGRAALLALASRKLSVPVSDLRVSDGVVHSATDASKRVSYGELVGARRFDVKVSENPKTKDPREYRIVGQPVPRFDIPAKVAAKYRYAADMAVPGMLHGRVIRPPQAGAQFVRVAEGQSLPGLVKVVQEGNFLGVVCEREEQAVEAARRLQVEWSKPQPMYWSGYDALYEHLRTAKPKVTKQEAGARGDVDAAFAKAARTVEARYEYPFQSHSSMGPACAVADVRDGGAIVWFGGQKPYPLRHALAELLKLPAEKVRVIWMPGPGSYGMNDADDCAADCVLLSQAVGRPVRLQYTRADGTGWDPKGPPIAFHLRAALDASGAVSAWDYEARGFSGRVRPSGTDIAGDSLAGQLIGGMKTKSTDLHQYSDESYGFASKRKVSHLAPWTHSLGTPLRTAHLRDPDGMSTCFASESFVDEVAYASGVDPVEFRLRHLTEPGHIAVVKAAAEKAGWQPHKAPRAPQGRIARGQGLAYAPRHGSLVAIVAQVEVDRQTGRYRVTRFTVAHDCGFVVNPLNLRGTIEANLMQGMSRAMHEAVRFDETRVLSVDWLTYPIVDMTEVPDAVDIVMLNNKPGARSYGAGEPTTRPVAAAIANALHDALGVRVRRVPLTPDAVLAALKA